VVTLVQALGTGVALEHVLGTTARVLAGFAIGFAIGLPIGMTLGVSARVYKAINPFLDFLRSVPITALLPLFLLIFGIGATAKIAAIAWATALVTVINTALGAASTSLIRRQAADSFRASARQRLLFVTLPDTLPHIFTGARIAISFAVVVAVVSEMLLSTNRGLGAYIYNASVMYRTEEVYVGIALTGALGYALNTAMARLDSRVIHWRGR
jgi:ABC-type nitrate/sulfonate/bicarbonate transport system permease component